MDNPVVCWVNVEVGGVVIGDGPIRHVISWSSTSILSRAGSFSLTVAAHDPRVDLLRNKRVVRCWAIVNGTPSEIGAGIIDTIQWTADGSGLVVTGDDLLAELRYRAVHDLQIYDETLIAPTKVYKSLGDPAVYTDLTNTYDGDLDTEDVFTLTSSDAFLYIGYTSPFTVLYTYLSDTVGHTNGQLSTLQYRYSTLLYTWNDAESELPVGEDTNIVDDVPYPVSMLDNNPPVDGTGTLLFKAPENWVATAQCGYGTPLYWIRIDPASTLDPVGIREFRIAERTKGVEDVSAVMGSYAPDAWVVPGDEWSSDSELVPTEPPVAGEVYRDTRYGSYAVFHGELVLSALVKLASRSGESFRLSAGRKLHWLRTNGSASSFEAAGVRAVRDTGNTRQASNLLTCQIVTLDETQDTNDLITRIYPFGAGNGRARLNLSNATLSMPTDYEMDTDLNFIRRISAEDPTTGYGRIERVMSFKDIGATDDLAVNSVEACNQLAQAALSFLQRHSSEHQFYRLVVVGVHKILRVGTQIHIIYRETVDGRVVKDIDDYFIILSVTHEFAQGQIHTTELEVGTTDALPTTDAEVLADVIEAGATYESHSQYVDALVVV